MKRDAAKLPEAVEIAEVRYTETVIEGIARVMSTFVLAGDIDRNILGPLDGNDIPFETDEADPPQKQRKRDPFFRAVGDADDLQKVRAGTKRAALLSALVNGATYDEVAALCTKAWSSASEVVLRHVREGGGNTWPTSDQSRKRLSRSYGRLRF